MNRRFLITFIILLFSLITLILFIINRIFITIPLVDLISDFTIPLLTSIFYDFSPVFYTYILIALAFFLLLFVSGYSLTRRKQLIGSIIYTFSLLGFLIIILFYTNYNYLGILFNQDLTLNTRLMLLLLFFPVNIGFSFILLLVCMDLFIFFKDLIKAREVWKHNRPNFQIEQRGNMTFINIDTDEHIFTPIPMLIISKYMQKKKFSVSWFVKGAFNHIFLLIITYLTGWPRARNMFFRFLGMKVGKNCHISERSIPDPLLPELIEFEDGSGCGIGVKLLTHDAINVKHGTFSFAPIKVCKNARIGAYSLILPGVTIGEGSIVGAGSIITKDIPPYSIAFGSPAKVKRELTEAERNLVKRNFDYGN